MWILLSLWLSIPRYGLYSLCRKNVNSDLKNGMQQHGSVFRIPEEITSLDYFSLSSTDSFSNMEEEYMRKKNIIFTLCYHTLGNSSYLQSSVELEEKKKEQGEPYNIKKKGSAESICWAAWIFISCLHLFPSSGYVQEDQCQSDHL